MTPTSPPEGDPGKLAYLHNPTWRPKLFAHLGSGAVKRNFCPGCTWPGENRPHEDSEACVLRHREVQ
jgi:hypothetical protein